MEAEYITSGIATKEAIWLRSFHDLNLTPKVDDPVESCDNIAAI